MDDVTWVLLSESLLRGSVDAAWSAVSRPETSVTWGFSFWLLPAVAAFGRSALLLKAYCALLMAAGLWLFYLGARKSLPPMARHALLAGIFLNDYALGFSGSLLSEAGYLALFGLLVWLAVGKDWLAKAPPGRLALLGLLTAGLIATRTLGALFLAGACAELLLTRKPRAWLSYGGAALLGAAAWFLAQRAASGQFSYYPSYWAAWLGLGPSVVLPSLASGAWFYLKGLTSLSFLHLPSVMPDLAWLKAGAALLVAGVALRGALVRPRETGHALLAVYGGLYFLVLSAWAYRGARYALPLYPVLLHFFLRGLLALSPRRAGAAAALAGLAFVATNAPALARTLRASWSGPAAVRQGAYRWLRVHARPGDLVVSMDMARVHYFTGLKGLHFVPAPSPEEFARRCRELGADYFLARAPGYVPASPGFKDGIRAQHEALAAFLARQDLFELVYEEPGGDARVLRLRPSRG